MKKIIVALVMVMVVMLSGCGERIGPTSKGKILDSSGYSDDIKQPGRHWLWPWQTMIVIDTSTNVDDERVEQVFMKDRLMMNFSVQFRGRVDGTDSVLNAMFSDLKPENDQVTWARAYQTYGKRTIEQVSRSVLSRYTSNEILVNYPQAAEELHQAITKAFKEQNSPLVVSNVVLGKPEPPKSIINGIEIAETKRIELEQVQADREKDIAKAEANRLVEQEKGKGLIVRAEAEAEANRIRSASLTPALLQFEQIQAYRLAAEKGNATTFIPVEALGSPGVQNRMFNK